jgi:hypothetical protein
MRNISYEDACERHVIDSPHPAEFTSCNPSQVAEADENNEVISLCGETSVNAQNCLADSSALNECIEVESESPEAVTNRFVDWLMQILDIPAGTDVEIDRSHPGEIKLIFGRDNEFENSYKIVFRGQAHRHEKTYSNRVRNGHHIAISNLNERYIAYQFNLDMIHSLCFWADEAEVTALLGIMRKINAAVASAKYSGRALIATEPAHRMDACGELRISFGSTVSYYMYEDDDAYARGSAELDGNDHSYLYREMLHIMGTHPHRFDTMTYEYINEEPYSRSIRGCL